MRDFASDPLKVFLDEFRTAVESKVIQPDAMSLATVDKKGQPSVRTVLYKGIVRGGFSFYTNYESPKSQHLHENPKASLLFFWGALNQQIRIEGSVHRLTRPESEAYFSTRPRLSQLGAWASAQSHPIANLEELEQKVKEMEDKFKDQDVPCPPFWGGFHLVPLSIEFWYGRDGRLHERFVCTRTFESGPWTMTMKSP